MNIFLAIIFEFFKTLIKILWNESFFFNINNYFKISIYSLIDKLINFIWVRSNKDYKVSINN